ncbi:MULTISPECIES: helix-turn-helix domain-containing protein [Niastella]|uniref:Helix-turn-helix transcriptional regulator n=1 Tax=Niastella soli TaxID=2821487 RepID=A0ABS3Z491_9BACT|nr:helix-turn-helix transcriptional regulator [Niastella soli]MBO9204191.1 helix-turn-helix transcriptional regulator [Niastella soli]
MITNMPEKAHQGRAVKRIREILNIKQEVLADALGISQQSVSTLESKDLIDPETLERIATTLKVPVDAIKNFNEESAINIIANTFQGESAAYVQNYKCTFNPFDKWVETVDKNEKLYEALLKSEREKIALLEKLLDDKKKK